MKITAIIKLAVAFIPVLIPLIKGLEKVIPGQGWGEQKLALVRTAIEAAYALKDEKDLSDFEVLWAILQNVITKAVTEFNEKGWPDDEAPE